MRFERRACSAMMYTKDQPKIYINDCLVHSVRHSSETMQERLEMVEREKMFRIQAIKRERSASLPSADISVSSALISLKAIADYRILHTCTCLQSYHKQ